MDKKDRLRILRVVSVLWLDSETQVGWNDQSHYISELGLIYTLGYLIHSDKNQMVIASSFDAENDHFNSVIKIPRNCIEKVEELFVEGFRDGQKIKRTKKSPRS